MRARVQSVKRVREKEKGEERETINRTKNSRRGALLCLSGSLRRRGGLSLRSSSGCGTVSDGRRCGGGSGGGSGLVELRLGLLGTSSGVEQLQHVHHAQLKHANKQRHKQGAGSDVSAEYEREKERQVARAERVGSVGAVCPG